MVQLLDVVVALLLLRLYSLYAPDLLQHIRALHLAILLLLGVVLAAALMVVRIASHQVGCVPLKIIRQKVFVSLFVQRELQLTRLILMEDVAFVVY